VRKENKSIR